MGFYHDLWGRSCVQTFFFPAGSFDIGRSCVQTLFSQGRQKSKTLLSAEISLFQKRQIMRSNVVDHASARGRSCVQTRGRSCVQTWPSSSRRRGGDLWSAYVDLWSAYAFVSRKKQIEVDQRSPLCEKWWLLICIWMFLAQKKLPPPHKWWIITYLLQKRTNGRPNFQKLATCSFNSGSEKKNSLDALRKSSSRKRKSNKGFCQKNSKEKEVKKDCLETCF